MSAASLMYTVIPQADSANQIQLSDVLAELRRVRWIMAVCILLATIAGLYLALTLPTRYTATTVLSPVSNRSSDQLGGGLTSLTSQFSGLSSLVGLSGSANAKRAESLAVLQSEALTESYIERNRLRPVLFDKQWNAGANRWKDKVPTLWEANEYFKKDIRTITINPKTGIVTLEIQWKDADTAARWANDLVKLANENLRAKAITEAERNIAYLESAVAKTDVVQVQQAIYAILQSEINKETLARGSEEYAIKVLDPAVPAEKPSSLPRALWVAIGFFASAGVCVLLAVFRVALSQHP